MPLDEKSARAFRLDLQVAREDAIKDAEAFEGVIHVIERLGSFLLGRVEALGKYKPEVAKVAHRRPLARDLQLYQAPHHQCDERGPQQPHPGNQKSRQRVPLIRQLPHPHLVTLRQAGSQARLHPLNPV